MKFILVLLTKAGKISKILGYIYTGLLAAESALNILVESLPANDIKKIKNIAKFVSVGANALRKVLDWLGKKDIIAESERDAESMTAAEFQRKITKEIKE